MCSHTGKLVHLKNKTRTTAEFSGNIRTDLNFKRWTVALPQGFNELVFL